MYARSRGVSDPPERAETGHRATEGGRSRPGCYRYLQSRAAQNATRRKSVGLLCQRAKPSRC